MKHNADFVAVGVDYCLTHYGIRNEDMTLCDFADYADPRDCEFRTLGYQASPSGS